jgi:outer membrane protein OmpA-like peptidoglycan-associated protein
LAAVRPKQAEADVLQALVEAAHSSPVGGTIVLVDSGLSTKGQLSFLNGDMFGVDPNEAARYLQELHLIPNLTGRSVVLVGLGGTADPQPALDENLHSRVVALWQTIATTAGASCVQSLDEASTRTAIDTDKPVKIVPLPAPPAFNPCGTTILADSDTVGFLPDQAVFRDPAAARATLQGLADQMEHGKQSVILTGTTATSGPEASRVELSQKRAGAVRDVLISLGVEASRINVSGAGSNGPNHVNDVASDGTLLPGPAAQNRSVVVTLKCS